MRYGGEKFAKASFSTGGNAVYIQRVSEICMEAFRDGWS